MFVYVFVCTRAWCTRLFLFLSLSLFLSPGARMRVRTHTCVCVCVRYLWVGLLLVDLNELPNKHLLNMDVAVVGDVGMVCDIMSKHT